MIRRHESMIGHVFLFVKSGRFCGEGYGEEVGRDQLGSEGSGTGNVISSWCDMMAGTSHTNFTSYSRACGERLGATEEPDMTSAEHIETAKQFLADSDREFLDGDELQASEKLWGAASHAVMAIAEQRGLRYRNHKELKILAQALADEYDDPFLRAGFSTAEKFHANFYHGFMEDFQIQGDRPVVHEFTSRVMELAAAA